EEEPTAAEGGATAAELGRSYGRRREEIGGGRVRYLSTAFDMHTNGNKLRRRKPYLIENKTLVPRNREIVEYTRQSFTAEQINEACNVDVKGNMAVFVSLTRSPKVSYDGNYFSYKPTHDVKDKKELLRLIQKFAEGIAVADLEDAYGTVMKDLQALEDECQIWLLQGSDLQEVIAYPNDPRVSIKVDDELKQRFRSTKLPCDMLDIEQELQENGMKPATDTAKRILMAQNATVLIKP
ncbi:hypothetical protein M8C21_026668, partial [Ambrosia artemisiifolia]